MGDSGELRDGAPRSGRGLPFPTDGLVGACGAAVGDGVGATAVGLGIAGGRGGDGTAPRSEGSITKTQLQRGVMSPL